ncbi:prepilin-type N-terminal cleavage/methylation domain-containing protein [Patescibacteria group bacterium]|nr:prepilin-type N-terminal cleavage/methylation domain-containing protein [Patescibacteria group bacterium]
MEKSINKNLGFTLIELIIYMILVVVITTIFIAFTADVMKSMSKELAVKEVHQNTRLVSNRIAQEIKTARSITSVAIDQITIVNKDNITVNISYNSTDKTVYFDNGSGPVAMSNNKVVINSLEFEHLSTNVIEIVMDVEQSTTPHNGVSSYQIQLINTVALRKPLY